MDDTNKDRDKDRDKNKDKKEEEGINEDEEEEEGLNEEGINEEEEEEEEGINEEEEEEEEESSKFRTIVARQAVHVLRLCSNDIHDFTLKMQDSKNFTREEVDKAQNDMVSALYLSMLLSDKKIKK